MYGTEPNRLRLRELSIKISLGFSSTRAGPILLPTVPITNNIVVSVSTAFRIRKP